jgi:hypothetical protein
VVGLRPVEFSCCGKLPGLEQLAQAVHTEPPADVDDTVINERP